MRRLFIIRKDLQLEPGKLAAMVGHCAEGYWTRLISKHALKNCRTKDSADSGTVLRERVDYYLSKALTKHQADLAKKKAEEEKSEQRKSFESWLQGN